MQYFQGKSVYKGIVMGPVAVLKKNDYQVKRARIEDPEAEVKRVKEAVEVSKKQLGRLYDKKRQKNNCRACIRRPCRKLERQVRRSLKSIR